MIQLSRDLDSPGPRVINFADILKYDYIPLASTLKVVLDVVTEAFGTPVEIEFAVDLTKDKPGMLHFIFFRLNLLSEAEQVIQLILKLFTMMT